MLHLFAHSLRTVLTVKCMARSHENDVRPCKSAVSHEIITGSVSPPHCFTTHLKKNKVLARHRRSGGGGRGNEVCCALGVCYIDVSTYLFWIYFDKGLLSALTSLKFSLPNVTFRILNALNVQPTGFKIILKSMNFTSPNELNTFARKNSSLETTKHLGTNNYFHFSRRRLYSHIFLASRKHS